MMLIDGNINVEAYYDSHSCCQTNSFGKLQRFIGYDLTSEKLFTHLPAKNKKPRVWNNSSFLKMRRS